jgi:hypothetical protein
MKYAEILKDFQILMTETKFTNSKIKTPKIRKVFILKKIQLISRDDRLALEKKLEENI